jgi:hypothetical protein
MKYVQDSKLTDKLERDLIRNELAQTLEQPRPFEAVRKGFDFFIGFMADMKNAARRYDVEFSRG